MGSYLALAKTNCGEVGFRQPKLESFKLSPSTATTMKTTSTQFFGLKPGADVNIAWCAASGAATGASSSAAN